MIYEAQVFGARTHDESGATTDRALRVLSSQFSVSNPPIGYLSGRTQMRNVVAEETGCSLLRAERLIEELEVKGHLAYEGDTYAPQRLPSSWTIVEELDAPREEFVTPVPPYR